MWFWLSHVTRLAQIVSLLNLFLQKQKRQMDWINHHASMLALNCKYFYTWVILKLPYVCNKNKTWNQISKEGRLINVWKVL